MSIFAKLFKKKRQNSRRMTSDLEEFVVQLDDNLINSLISKVLAEERIIEHVTLSTMSFAGTFLKLIEKGLTAFHEGLHEKEKADLFFDYDELFIEALCYAIFFQMTLYIIKDNDPNFSPSNRDKNYFEFLCNVMARAGFFCNMYINSREQKFKPEIFVERIKEYSYILLEEDDHFDHFQARVIQKINTDEFGNLKLPEISYKVGQGLAVHFAAVSWGLPSFDSISREYWDSSSQ